MWWRRADVPGKECHSLLVGIRCRFSVIRHHCHWPALSAFGQHFATTISRRSPGEAVDQMTTGWHRQAYKSTVWFSVLKFVLHFSTYTQVPYIYYVCMWRTGYNTEIYMWLNGYFTSSVVVRHCPSPPPPPPSSTVSNFKNSHLHILPITSTDFLRKIYPQFTRSNIHISAFYHWPHCSVSCEKVYPQRRPTSRKCWCDQIFLFVNNLLDYQDWKWLRPFKFIHCQPTSCKTVMRVERNIVYEEWQASCERTIQLCRQRHLWSYGSWTRTLKLTLTIFNPNPNLFLKENKNDTAIYVNIVIFIGYFTKGRDGFMRGP